MTACSPRHAISRPSTTCTGGGSRSSRSRLRRRTGMVSLRPRRSDATDRCASGGCQDRFATSGLSRADRAACGAAPGRRKARRPKTRASAREATTTATIARALSWGSRRPEQPGSGAGNARVNAEPGRDCRKLAQTIADGADRHRHEQPPRRQLDETPEREHYPRGERQRQACCPCNGPIKAGVCLILITQTRCDPASSRAARKKLWLRLVVVPPITLPHFSGDVAGARIVSTSSLGAHSWQQHARPS